MNAVAEKSSFALAANDSILVTVKQLDALANVISEIDSYKHWEPHRLPLFISQGKHAISMIWNNLLYPMATPGLIEVEPSRLDEFASCLKSIENLIASSQIELLQPMIETAHDLIILMAGDKANLIYPEE